MVIDPVIVFYGGLFVIFCLFMGYDTLQNIVPVLQIRASPLTEKALYLPFIFIFIAAVGSYTDPGIRFTSSELQLSLLPHPRKLLLSYLFFERIVIHTFMVILLIIIAVSFLPLASVLIWGMSYIGSFIASLFFRWRLFSKSLFHKTAACVWTGSLLALSFTRIPLFLLFILFIVTVMVLLVQKNEVNWGKVVEVNDARVWNMMIIGQMTNVHIKPKEKYGVTQILRRRKKDRFVSAQKLYERIWIGYFLRSAEYLWKTILTVCLILLIIPIKVDWMLIVTLPIAVGVYHEVAGGLFLDVENVFHSLPVDDKVSISSYLKGAYLAALPLLISFISIQWILGEAWIGIVIQIIGLVLWMYRDLERVIQERWLTVQKEKFYSEGWKRFAGFIALGAGVFHPLCMFLIPLLLLTTRRKLPFNKVKSS